MTRIGPPVRDGLGICVHLMSFCRRIRIVLCATDTSTAHSSDATARLFHDARQHLEDREANHAGDNAEFRASDWFHHDLSTAAFNNERGAVPRTAN